MKKILRIIGSILAWIVPIRFCEFLKHTFSYVRSGYCQTGFRSVGSNFFLGENAKVLNPECISCGNNVSIHQGSYITPIRKYGGRLYNPRIIIGDNVNIGRYNHITSINMIEIRGGVLIGSYTTITDNSHGDTKNHDHNKSIPNNRPLYSKGAVVIEEGVWIGDKVTILPNVRIGKYAIIAANSVITKNVPEYSIVAGIPAKIVGQLPRT